MANLILSKESSESEIKRYFNAVLELSKSDNEFPINLDEVWMLIYSEKGKAVRALKENFIEGVDYNTFAQNGKTETGGYISTKTDDTPEEIMARALTIAQATIELQQKEIKQVPKKICFCLVIYGIVVPLQR